MSAKLDLLDCMFVPDYGDDDERVPGVSRLPDGWWRVRGTRGKSAGISFGAYPTKSEANALAKIVLTLTTKAAGLRIREVFGITGRNSLRKQQKQVIRKDRAKEAKRRSRK
jgi:hypothetical protein